MIISKQHQQKNLLYRVLSVFVVLALFLTSVIPPTNTFAQAILNLPTLGTMVSVSSGFTPTIIRGLTIHPDNPLLFDFIVDTGNAGLEGGALRKEAKKLVKYFLTSLTVPEKEMWVNLSPYEKDRIIPQDFGVTEMGVDLLAQDYLLKQLTASLVYPEDDLGHKFWERVHAKAQQKYGTTEIPVNTFNKVWIVPDKAEVYEHEGSVFVVKQHLKVLLEEDFLALQKNLDVDQQSAIFSNEKDKTEMSRVSSEVIREVLIPEIEKEVNEGQNFAQLRQVYNSVILATWYKQNLKESLLGHVYMDKNKIKGVDIEDRGTKQKIYDQYIAAFKQGVYDYIREDVDQESQKVVPRKYFSGGTHLEASSVLYVHPQGTIEDSNVSGILHPIDQDFMFSVELIEYEESNAGLLERMERKAANDDNYGNEDWVVEDVDKVTKASSSVIVMGNIEELVAENGGFLNVANAAIRDVYRSESSRALILESRENIKGLLSDAAELVLTHYLQVTPENARDDFYDVVSKNLYHIAMLVGEYFEDIKNWPLLFSEIEASNDGTVIPASMSEMEDVKKYVERAKLAIDEQVIPIFASEFLRDIATQFNKDVTLQQLNELDIRSLTFKFTGKLGEDYEFFNKVMRDQDPALIGRSKEAYRSLINRSMYGWVLALYYQDRKMLFNKLQTIYLGATGLHKDDIGIVDAELSAQHVRELWPKAQREFNMGGISANFLSKQLKPYLIEQSNHPAVAKNILPFNKETQMPNKIQLFYLPLQSVDEQTDDLGRVDFDASLQTVEGVLVRYERFYTVGKHGFAVTLKGDDGVENTYLISSAQSYIPYDFHGGDAKVMKILDERSGGSPVSSSPMNPGGIDFNSALLDLQIQRDGKGVPLPIHKQPIQDMNIEGFLPIIINVTPISVPMLLGVVNQKDPFKSAKGLGESPVQLVGVKPKKVLN